MGRDIGVIGLGAIVLGLMAWGLRGFFMDPNVHIGLRVGVGAVGVVVLFWVIKLTGAKIMKAVRGRRRDK